jgi:hypothetical protein
MLRLTGIRLFTFVTMSFNALDCNGTPRAIRARGDDWRWWRRS